MLGVDPEFGASLLRLWIAAGSAALLVVLSASGVACSRTAGGESGAASPPSSSAARVRRGHGVGVARRVPASAVPQPNAARLSCAPSNSTPRPRCRARRWRASTVGRREASKRHARRRCSHRRRTSPRPPLMSRRGSTLLADMMAFARHDGADLEPALKPLRRVA